MALPTQHELQPPAPSVVGATYGMISRFLVESSDVIDEELKITVRDERLGRLEWTQVRRLAETEIVEVLTHVPSNRVSWTTHKPTKGWYIRLRSPALPPGTSIPIAPITAASVANFPTTALVDGCFTFSCRTMVLDFSGRSTNQSTDPALSSPSRHSYPPNSPASSSRASISASSTSTLVQDDAQPSVQPASDADASAPEPPATTGPSSSAQPQPASASTSASFRPSSLQQPLLRPPGGPPPSQITHFLITPEPHLVDTRGLVQQRVDQQAANQRVSGFFSSIGKRLIGAIEHKHSFTIRIPSPQLSPLSPPSLLTLLTVYDTTPALRLGTPTSGTIELDEGIARLLGVDRGFYIAACLAFLEFLGDKDSYIAASEG